MKVSWRCRHEKNTRVSLYVVSRDKTSNVTAVKTRYKERGDNRAFGTYPLQIECNEYRTVAVGLF